MKNTLSTHFRTCLAAMRFTGKTALFLIAIATCIGGALLAEAAINKEVNYQGKLTDSSSITVANGDYNMEFKLYTVSSGGSPVWTETRTSGDKVTVTNGLFSIMLGQVATLSAVDFNQTLYLGVNVGGTSTPGWDGEMTPRKKLGAVPAAFVAETLNGFFSHQFLRNDVVNSTSSAVTFLKVEQAGAGAIAEFVGTGSTTAMIIKSDGKIGIGTTTPAQSLSVVGGMRLTGALFDSANASGTSGMVLQTTGTGTQWVATSSLGISGGTGTNYLSLGSGHAYTSTSTDYFKSAYFVASSTTGTSTFAGAVGIGTTTPSASFYIQGKGGINPFAVASSTGAAMLTLLQNGNLGIGTSTPGSRLALAGGSFIHTAQGDPVLKGSYDTAGDAYDVSVSGKYAYVADGSSGLQIVDVSNPASPALVGTYASAGTARDVQSSGKYAYVAGGPSGLHVIDVSSPASSTLAGTYDTSGDAFGVYVSGKYAYVADSSSGLQIIDISDPSAPSLAGTYNTAGTALGVYAAGRYAYVADGSSGLQIVDVSNPVSPALVGTYNTSGSSNGVQVSGRYAYVADGNSGLQIVDVSNPASPALAGTYNTSGTAYDVQVSGRYAYVADGTSLQVIDISSSTAPSLVGSYAAGAFALGVQASGKHAYMADSTSGIKVIDINGIETPALSAGSIEAGSLSATEGIIAGGDIHAQGGLHVGISGIFSRGTISSYVASSTQANAVSASFMGGGVGIGTTTPAQSLSVVGGMRLTGALFDSANASGTSGMVLQTTGTGTQWVATSSLGISGGTGTNYLSLGSGHAYTSTSTDWFQSAFFVASSTTSTSTFAGGLVAGGGTGLSVYQDGKVAIGNGVPDTAAKFLIYNGSGGYFRVDTDSSFSASTGVNGGLLGFTSAGNLGIGTTTPSSSFFVLGRGGADPFTIASSTGTAMLTLLQNGNLGIGTSTPTSRLALAGGSFVHTAYGSPTLLGSYNTSGEGYDVHVSGKYAYVADGASGVHVMDISNPSSPVLLGTYDTAGDARDIRTSGRYAYVADGTSGLVVLDISNPSTPSLAGSYDTSGEANGVHVSGRYAYVADHSSGLQVIDISNPAAPSLAGTYNTAGFAYDVRVSGKYAYVADLMTGLQIIDVSIPSAPALVGTYDTVGIALGVYISGRYAYVADLTSGLQVIDISVPSAPTLAGSYNSLVDTNEVYVSGKYAYVADGDYGLQVLDVSSSSAPYLVGTYDTTGTSTGVFVSGKRAYVSDGVSGLVVVDLDGIESPALLAGSVEAGGLIATEDVSAGGDIFAQGGLHVGMSGIFSRGAISAYVSTSSNSVSASFMGGNVGIGTTTPSASLHIQGRGGVNPFAISSSTGAAMLTLLQNGNLGIGTTTPAQSLSVVGGMRLTGALFDSANASGTSGMVLQTTGTGTQWVATSSLGISGGTGTNYLSLGSGHVYTSTSTDYFKSAYFVASSTTGTSTFAGLVGIGTTTPTALLHVVVPSGNPDIFKLTNSTGYDAFSIDNGTLKAKFYNGGLSHASLGFGGARGLGSDSSGLGLITASLTRMTITSAGLIGIGTTSPIATFAVMGSTSAPTTVLFDVASSTGTSAFRITAAGLVGIGTTTPAAKLSIQGTSASDALAITGSDGVRRLSISDAGAMSLYFAGNVRFPDAAAGSGLIGTEDLADGFGISVSDQYLAVLGTNGKYYFGTNDGTGGMVISGFDGSVGIGTSTPSTALVVVGTTTSTYFSGNGAGLTGVVATAAPAGNSGNVQFNNAGATGGSDSLFWDISNSQLGIGTSTPTAKLAIQGVSGSSAQLFDIASSSGESLMHVMSNGNVGIGTSTPAEKLHVAGNILIGARADSAGAWTLRSNSTAGTIASGGTSAIGTTTAMAVFNGSLYAGTSKANSAEIYRYDGSGWTRVSSTTAGAIGTTTTVNIDTISAMSVWNGHLYVGTAEASSAEVYRYNGNSSWTKVSSSTAGVVGDRATTTAINSISAMTVHGGNLYVGTTKTNGAEVYRYNGNKSWTKVSNIMTNAGTIGSTANVDTVTMLVSFQGFLFAGTSENNASAALYRYDGQGSTGTGFTIVGTAGTFSGTAATGTSVLTSVGSIRTSAVYNGKMYLGIDDGSGTGRVVKWDGNTTAGGNYAIVSSSTAGIIAEDVGAQTTIDQVRSMAIYNDDLYVGTVDTTGIAEVYKLDNGMTWSKISSSTAGTINTNSASPTTGITGVFSMAVYNDDLWVGTEKASASEIYSYNIAEGQSYNLAFEANSDDADAPQNGLTNKAFMQFQSENTAYNNNGNVNTGKFVFSHGINTVTGAYDLAEDYPTDDDTLAPGDLVSLDTRRKGFVRKAQGKSDRDVIGIYSVDPALRLSQMTDVIDGARAIPVALAGRVPVTVTLENGPIRIGDYLTSSMEPGKAAKATKPSRVIGRALGAYSGAEGEEPSVTVFIGAESISWNDLQDAESDVSEIADESSITDQSAVIAFVDTINGMVEDLAFAILNKADNLNIVITNKLTAVAASVQDLFAKNFSILPNGSISLPSGENQIAGIGMLSIGATDVFIPNEQIDENAIIYVTATSEIDSPLYVAKKIPGKGFHVRIKSASAMEITFDWFFIKTYRPKGNADQEVIKTVEGNSATSTMTTTITSLSTDTANVTSSGEGATSDESSSSVSSDPADSGNSGDADDADAVGDPVSTDDYAGAANTGAGESVSGGQTGEGAVQTSEGTAIPIEQAESAQPDPAPQPTPAVVETAAEPAAPASADPEPAPSAE